MVPFSERWHTAPYSWTTHEKRSTEEDPSKATEIRRFYLRSEFGVRFARRLYELHGDADVLRAAISAFAPFYLKFHEVLTSGYTSWFDHEGLIRETTARLQRVGGSASVGKALTGPNVYVKRTRIRDELFQDVGFVEADLRAEESDDES